MTREEKIEKLRELRSTIKENKDLPFRKGAQIVCGDGNPNADVYFLGEAPGYHEDRLGKPFMGQAGRVIELLLKKIGLSRRDVYLSTLVKYKPSTNQKILLYEARAFSSYIDQEIEIVKPKIIVTLGRYSLDKFLPTEKISGIHGKSRSIIWNSQELIIIPLINPQAALKAASMMRQLEQDFLSIKNELANLEIKRQEEAEKFRLAEEERKKPQQVGLF